MVESTSTQDLTVRGVDVTVAGLAHWECQNCHAEIETPSQMDANHAIIHVAYMAARAGFKRKNGLLAGEDIRALRKAWGLTQAQSAAIFGGGPTAFAKYEAEDVTQSAAMDRLLRVARAVPAAFAWLTRAAEPPLAREELQRFVASIQKSESQRLKALGLVNHQTRETFQESITVAFNPGSAANDVSYAMQGYGG